MFKKRERRICKGCGNEFWFRLCYAKRPGRTGVFCSAECRHKNFVGEGNPNAGPLAKYGSKVVQHARQIRNMSELRRLAIEKLSRVHSRPIECFKCGCPVFKVLQINHLLVFKTKEMGGRLARKVLSVSDEEAKKQYDLRCQVCNWAYHVTTKYGVNYEIKWKEPMV